MARYAVNVILVIVLLAAGYASGRQLRRLAMGTLTTILLIVISLGVVLPVAPSHAHGTAPASAATRTDSNGPSLGFVHPDQRHGYANSTPLLWDLHVLQAGVTSVTDRLVIR